MFGVGAQYNSYIQLPEPCVSCPKLNGDGVGYNKVSQVIECHKVPYALAVQSFLATASFVLQGLVDVKKPSGQVSPISLFCIGIADSGERKSTIHNEFNKSVYKFISDKQVDIELCKNNYDRELLLWNSIRKGLIRKIVKSEVDKKVDSITYETGVYDNDKTDINCLKIKLEEHDSVKPKMPLPTGLAIFADTNPEALAHHINEGGVKSSAIITSEGEEFFVNGFKNKTSLLNSAWSGEGKIRSRVGTGSHSISHRMTLNIMMQPDIANKIFIAGGNRLRGSGTMARMLWAFPQSNIGRRNVDEQPLTDTRDLLFQSKIIQLMEDNAEANKNKQFERKVLSFSTEATGTWFIVANEIERQICPGGRFEGFSDHAAKLADNIARIAAVLHGFEYGMDSDISNETLLLAVNLCFFFSDEFLRLFSLPSKEDIDAMKIDNWFNKKIQEGHRYLLKRYVLTYGPLKKADQLNFAISSLQALGKLTLLNVPACTGDGRKTKPTQVIDLSPALRTDLNLLNQAVFNS